MKSLEIYETTLSLMKGTGDFMPKSIDTKYGVSNVWVVIYRPLEGTLSVFNRDQDGRNILVIAEGSAGYTPNLVGNRLYAEGSYDYEYSNPNDIGHAVLWHQHFPSN